MLSNNDLHGDNHWLCVRKQLQKNLCKQDILWKERMVFRHNYSVAISLSLSHVACLYFVLKITKTTNTSTKNHKIFAFPCVAIEKPVYLHIFCNRNRRYYEYGNKNTANIRSQPQYDSIIWQLAFPARIGWEKPVFLCQKRMASSAVQGGCIRYAVLIRHCFRPSLPTTAS